MPSKIDVEKVSAEIDIFRLEYPEYDNETVSDYVQLLDYFTEDEKNLFIRKLGY